MLKTKKKLQTPLATEMSTADTMHLCMQVLMSDFWTPEKNVTVKEAIFDHYDRGQHSQNQTPIVFAQPFIFGRALWCDVMWVRI